MKTIAYKDPRGGWTAKSRLDLGRVLSADPLDRIPGTNEKERVLQINTYKDTRGNLVTKASVHHSNGTSMMHSFAFGTGGDYSTTMASDKVRCTEKTVNLQHALCMTDEAVEALKAAIEAHYSK